MKNYCPKMKLKCKFLKICNDEKGGYYNYKLLKKIKIIDLDYILFKQTKRKIIKKEFLSIDEAKKNIDKYHRLGLRVAVLRYVVKDREFTDNEIRGVKIIEYKDKKCVYKRELQNRNNVLIAAQNDKNIEEFIKYENLYVSNPRVCFYIGIYLGYPLCCIKNHYKKIYVNGDFDEKSVDLEWKKLKQERNYICPLVNNIMPLFIHYFCD